MQHIWPVHLFVGCQPRKGTELTPSGFVGRSLDAGHIDYPSCHGHTRWLMAKTICPVKKFLSTMRGGCMAETLNATLSRVKARLLTSVEKQCRPPIRGMFAPMNDIRRNALPAFVHQIIPFVRATDAVDAELRSKNIRVIAAFLIGKALLRGRGKLSCGISVAYVFRQLSVFRSPSSLR